MDRIVDFLQALRDGKVIFFDGGMGTELAARGAPPSAVSTLDAPEAVLAVLRDYRQAGADVLLTNTFGANEPSLARAGRTQDLERCVAESVRIAREALQGGPGWLAGDIGPSGEFLEPYGSFTPERMKAVFEQPARLLAEAGVDLFIVESMSHAGEMALAVQACRAVAPELPIVASMAFDPARGGFRTNTGLEAGAAAKAMAEAGADIIGANCGSVTPLQMIEIVRAFRAVTDRPILIQANAGLPELLGGRTVYRLAPEAFASNIVEALRAGAGLAGGCCGTTPAHIRALRQAVEQAGMATASHKGR